jgi:regulatory protein
MTGRGPRAPRPVTRAGLEQAALDYLGRFASSAENLKRVLMRRLRRAALAPGDPAHAEAVGWIEALVARFRRGGLLDDRAYAEAQVASLHRRGLGRRAIGQRLAAKGVGRDEIAAALDALHEEEGDAELAAAAALARRRRLGPYRPEAERAARRDKDLAALGRAGFAYALARRVIDAADTDALEAALRVTGGTAP